MRPLLCLLAAIFVQSGAAQAQDIAITNATVYSSPDAAAQLQTTVVIQNGIVTGLGRGIHVRTGVPTLPCHQCFVFAGFWNTHVHFTGPQWAEAAHLPSTDLTRNMQTMLTHSGFTTVVDTGSDPTNTMALRRRVKSGEVAGPRIYTAGSGLYPPHGIPFYLHDLPEAVRAMLPQPSTPAAAIEAVRYNQTHGTDIVKQFTGSYLTPDNIAHMPLSIAQAAVAEAHRHGQLAFAHPSDLEGVSIAIKSGVDVLAHAPDTIGGIDNTLVQQLVDHHAAMVPTLQLFSGNSNIAGIRKIVAQFHAHGGRLLFGTDTGFLTDYRLTGEYEQLKLVGLSFRDVLAMLTTSPAAEFKVSSHAGSIKVGGDGDLTILSSDPAGGELRNFTHGLYTIRAGSMIFRAETH